MTVEELAEILRDRHFTVMLDYTLSRLGPANAPIIFESAMHATLTWAVQHLAEQDILTIMERIVREEVNRALQTRTSAPRPNADVVELRR